MDTTDVAGRNQALWTAAAKMGLMARMRSSTFDERAFRHIKRLPRPGAGEDQPKSKHRVRPSHISLDRRQHWLRTAPAWLWPAYGHHQAGVTGNFWTWAAPPVTEAFRHAEEPVKGIWSTHLRAGMPGCDTIADSIIACKAVNQACCRWSCMNTNELGRCWPTRACRSSPRYMARRRPNRRSRQVKPENTRNPIYIQQNTKVITQKASPARPVTHMCRDYANGRREALWPVNSQTARLQEHPDFCQRERSRPGATVSVICNRRRRCHHLEPSGQPGPGDLHLKAFGQDILEVRNHLRGQKRPAAMLCSANRSLITPARSKIGMPITRARGVAQLRRSADHYEAVA
jgi:hypothetical protein